MKIKKRIVPARKKKKPIKSAFQNIDDMAFKHLLEQVQTQSNKIIEVLKESPGDVIGHKLFQKYALLVHTILQGILKAQTLDRYVLIGDALNGVVFHLIKHDFADAAKNIGDHLEPLASQIQKAWNERRKSF